MDYSQLKTGVYVRVKCTSNVEFHCMEVVLSSYIAAGEWEVTTRGGNNKGFINEEDIEEILI